MAHLPDQNINAQADVTAQQIRLMFDSSSGRFMISWLVLLEAVNAIVPSTVPLGSAFL